MQSPAPIQLRSCPKAYSQDLDKARDPASTIRAAHEILANSGKAIYAGSRRIDTGRLGIPVYLGLCGPKAREIMPTRKQMGKGSSREQAEASAIMEFVERFAFFSFWQNPGPGVRARWSKAEQLFGSALQPVEEVLLSVHDNLAPDAAREILDSAEWLFYPATNLGTGEITWLPLDWYRMLGEFNGSSAGNTAEESLLQGISELIERHVSAIVDSERPELATIDPASCSDPALLRLLEAFKRNSINLVLKDISLGMPLPGVAALAWDSSTFPQKSEIVFTAGVAASPQKAAIRAITEVAQLAGDFNTGSCYEASGLPKFGRLEDIQWLLQGPAISIDALPDKSAADILAELSSAVAGLAPLQVYAVETTHPDLGIPAHYSICPGLKFRERDKNESLGLFTGRKLAEEAPLPEARAGLEILARHYPGAHFLPFFYGLLELRSGRHMEAAAKFMTATKCQPDAEAAALAAFYAGYAHTLADAWQEALPWLDLALAENPAMKEAANLLGVANFKLGNYPEAELHFDQALKIDKGSAMDLANRGVVRKLQGKREQAMEDLANALELEPGLAFAATHLQELLQDGQTGI